MNLLITVDVTSVKNTAIFRVIAPILLHAQDVLLIILLLNVVQIILNVLTVCVMVEMMSIILVILLSVRIIPHKYL